MWLEFSRQILGKYSNIKFHENPSSGNSVVPCRRTDRQTDMTRLTVTFQNFANVPKKDSVYARLFWPGPPHSRGFLDHKQRCTAVGRTPLDEWSARRRDFYLTTHNTHNRQTSTPPAGFEPAIPAGEQRQTHALDSAVTGTDTIITNNHNRNELPNHQTSCKFTMEVVE